MAAGVVSDGKSIRGAAVAQYDAVVVGAGPGGGMAACRLAENGLSVLVVEKDLLPRPKACGGALSHRIRKLINWNFSELIEAATQVQRFGFDFKDYREVTSMSPVLFVERAQFDKHFIDRALSIGAGRTVLKQGLSVKAVSEDSEGVTLTAHTGEVFRARYVVAADGASSQIARCLGLFRHPSGAAIDATVLLRPPVFDYERKYATFNLNCVPWGYGWSFPKRHHMSCGVCGWIKPKGLPVQMKSFLERKFLSGSIDSYTQRAHPVPIFQGHRSVATGRTCLVGDAAHLVDPIVGEGIIYAVESGMLAADVITMLCRGSCRSQSSSPVEGKPTYFPLGDIGARQEYSDCRIYDHAVRYGIARHLNIIRLMASSYFSSPEQFYGSL